MMNIVFYLYMFFVVKKWLHHFFKDHGMMELNMQVHYRRGKESKLFCDIYYAAKLWKIRVRYILRTL